MSGIYGVYRYDGASVDPSWLQRMKTAMAYYGPDGGNSKVDGPVGMGHLLLEVNPEDVFERQPVRGARGLVVSAARLDNRDALLETFSISSAEARYLSDGHLVSLAFDRWGEDVSSHLQGDWSLAAWNTKERRLLLARDACGNASLYYYEGKGFKAFASCLKALLALPDVFNGPDSLRLAEVLVSWEPDAELTAYKGIRRLIWAHAMSVSSQGNVRKWRTWSPLGREMLRYRRDEEYVEAFREHYTRAVQSCLRTRKPLAAHLSGGRDSGSVVAMAAPLLAGQGRGLTAYTSVPCLPPDGANEKRRVGNEWALAHATAEMAGTNVQHVAIDAANYGVIQGIEHILDVHDGPSHSPINHFWVQAIAETASQNGAGGLLTGLFGNASVSWSGNGSALLALRQGYPATAFRLLLHAESNPWLTLKRQVLKPLLTPGLDAIKRLRGSGKNSWHTYSAINLHMVSELNLEGRMQAAGYDPVNPFSLFDDVRPIFFDPDMGIGVNITGEVAIRHSLYNLDPTNNLSMVEFLLRVPDNQFRHGDEGSWLFRRAFRNRMPQSVLTNQRKGYQAADVGHRILRELPAFRERLSALDGSPAVREMLDMSLLHRCLNDLVAKVNPDTTANANMILLRGMGVGLFLLRLADS